MLKIPLYWQFLTRVPIHASHSFIFERITTRILAAVWAASKFTTAVEHVTPPLDFISRRGVAHGRSS